MKFKSKFSQSEKAIHITRPYLPPIEEYQELVEQIWSVNHLTNHGPLLREFEYKIKEHFNASHFHFVNNGTNALKLALKSLAIEGDVITTPYSFVATTNAILWEKCRPVFVDVCEDDFNIDPGKIEAALTDNTTAILATHVYGNACDIDSIQRIAERYNLKVIYDAAHCFGTEYKNESIFNFGDISITSFHATKVFHTTEGGGLFCKDPELSNQIKMYANFGFDHNSYVFSCAGINGKNSEFHAAMGLCNFKRADELLNKRKEQWLYYKHAITDRYETLGINKICQFNYAYFPVKFNSEQELLLMMKKLEDNNIFARRYFYPSLSNLPYVEKQDLPISDDLSQRTLCLPLYHSLTRDEQDLAVESIS